MSSMAASKISALTYLPFLALVIAAHSAVGFFLPPAHVSKAPTTGVTRAATAGFLPRGGLACSAPPAAAAAMRSNHRCHLHRSSTGLSMEVDANVLRLQAAELGHRLKGTSVYFVGMMGTGKSTVARALADVMRTYIFLDTDVVIEKLLNTTVGDVFAKDGEEAFRSVESQVLDQVQSYVKMCIATGGGIVTQQDNWGRMHSGIVVWLDMQPEDILARMMKDPEQVQKRPLLAGSDPLAKLDEILANRRSQYEQARYCTVVVLAAREVEASADSGRKK